jgi:hypothetical protein
MRLTHFGAASLSILMMTATSWAECRKPSVPACATEPGPFENAADDCRIQMLAFRDAMEGYASCLEATSADDARLALEEYERVRIQFNQRARQTPD